MLGLGEGPRTAQSSEPAFRIKTPLEAIVAVIFSITGLPGLQKCCVEMELVSRHARCCRCQVTLTGCRSIPLACRVPLSLGGTRDRFCVGPLGLTDLCSQSLKLLITLFESLNLIDDGIREF
jgi:hypothetical protein